MNSLSHCKGFILRVYVKTGLPRIFISKCPYDNHRKPHRNWSWDIICVGNMVSTHSKRSISDDEKDGPCGTIMICMAPEDDNVIMACEWTSKMRRKKTSGGLFKRASLIVNSSVYVIRHIYLGRLLDLGPCM